MMKIVLDAGHGLPTAGKRTLNGVNGVVHEWTMNNNVCNYAAAILSEYMDSKMNPVEIFRADDITGKTDVPVQERTNRINNINPDLSVSIHHNANTGSWGNWTGVCAFYTIKKSARDADLARLFAAELAKQTGLYNRGGLQDQSYLKMTLHMIRETKPTIPSILAEGGFMDSTVDYPVITSENGQRAYGQAVANVCINHFKLQKKTATVTQNNIGIRGHIQTSVDVMEAFVVRNNPAFNREIAAQFEKQGRIYDIRGDVAFCQSIKETGWFKYGGGTAVTPDQNNFSGMGVTSIGMKGNSFASVELGVKAQMQHLYAYACKDPLPGGESLVDPRFHLITRGIAPNWQDLSNRWAMTATYGQDILKLYDDLKMFAASYKPPLYRVQVGAYTVKTNADAMLDKIKNAKFAEAFVTPKCANGLHRVQLGAFGERKNADAKLAEVKKAGFSAFISISP
jgi:N-acetylmuramoyl-L-alanine amidase